MMHTPRRTYERKAIRPEMTVRQVASDFPASRAVFLRYGEPDDRPGKFGHLEPLAHFARRHGVSLDKLLHELAAATGVPLDVRSRYAERVHRPFLLAAMVVTLSLGAGWGGWLLWQIGVAADFSAVPGGAVVAHGAAQLWGFVALFVMGVSLRTALHAAPRHPLGRLFCGGLLAAGFLGVVGGFAWFVMPAAWPPLAAIGGAALLLMAFAFWTLQLTVLGTKWTTTRSRAVMASGFWLVAWAGITLAFRVAAAGGGPDVYTNSQRMLLIELAVFGFAMNSIYGFGQMLLPGFLRIGSTRAWALETTWWLHNLGTAGLCAATAWTGAGLLTAPASVLVAAGAVFYVVGQRVLFGKPRQSHRLEQGHPALDYFPPLAFFWLVASLLMLAGGHVWAAVTGEAALPHAFVGAVRHALTVGFVTTLILGVGLRLLPVVEHRVLPLPGLVVPVLLLIGVGNLLRVGSELAVLVTSAAFPIMPFSAVLEWSALLLFTISLVATIWHVDPLLRRGRVTSSSSVAVLLAEHPELEDGLIDAGYDYIARTRSVPQELTFGDLAASEGRDEAELVGEINAWLSEPRPDVDVPPRVTTFEGGRSEAGRR